MSNNRVPECLNFDEGSLPGSRPKLSLCLNMVIEHVFHASSLKVSLHNLTTVHRSCRQITSHRNGKLQYEFERIQTFSYSQYLTTFKIFLYALLYIYYYIYYIYCYIFIGYVPCFQHHCSC